MGVDIMAFAERRTSEGYVLVSEDEVFEWRSYDLYGFLADVRNYSEVPPILQPRGLPDDATSHSKYWLEDSFGCGWLSIEELTSFDYDQTFEDRRITVGNDGGCTSKPGGGKITTFREFLGTGYFEELEQVRTSGADRIVFGFC